MCFLLRRLVTLIQRSDVFVITVIIIVIIIEKIQC
jgi:hypothetical protein